MIKLINFIKKIYSHRMIIFSMAMREIQSRYIGTLGGMVWSVIQPLMMIFVYWFVFSVGFRVHPTNNLPYIVVFMCGLMPWMMFSEVLLTSVKAIDANAHLVKNTLFPTEILPIVYLFSGLIAHIIMLIIFFIIMLICKVPLSLYNFQFVYYLCALSIMGLGLSWFVSAVNVFIKDTQQILGVVINVWFWLTPVVWNLEMLPHQVQKFIKLNPFYYIVTGYKASFIYHTPFWLQWRLGLYFWFVCLCVFFIGALTFRRLKPEFSEVL